MTVHTAHASMTLRAASVALREARGASERCLVTRDDAIRRAVQEGIPQSETARLTGLSRAAICKIVNRR